MTRNLSQASKVTLESPLNLNTIKITDEGDRDQNRFDTHVTLQTPDLTTPALLEQNKSLESLINSAGSAYETQEEKRLKIDLSNVSFLKPHVMNPKTYELAHQGHTREQAMKTDTIKSLEQQRRYKRFLGTYESKKNNVQYQKVQI